ncbi:MAG: TolC family protein [Bacteroides sp.]|nr:TolC family protein [Bacteroides sp.]
MKYVVLAVIILHAGLCGLYAADNFSVTLDKSLESAFERNIDLQQQLVALKETEKAYSDSWNTFLPAMSLSAGLSNSHGTDIDSSWSWNGSAGVSISFTAGIPDQLKKLRLSYDTQLVSYAALKAQIEQQVSMSFYSLIAAQMNIGILKDSLSLAEAEYQLIQTQYNRGLASELELLQADYARQSVKPQIQKAESEYKAALADFSLLTGLDFSAGDDIRIDGAITLRKLNLPDEQELIDAYLHSRCDVKLKYFAAEDARLTYRTQTASRRAPTLSLSENLSLNDNAAKDALSLSGSFRVGISLPLNAFIPGASEFLALESYKHASEKAEAEYLNILKKAEYDIRKKVQEIARLRETVDLSVLNEQIAERSWQLSSEGYRAGLVSQTDAELARQKTVSARQNLLQAEIDYISAAYNLADALALSVDDFYARFEAAEASGGAEENA